MKDTYQQRKKDMIKIKRTEKKMANFDDDNCESVDSGHGMRVTPKLKG